ncbi:hypothetical protein [Mesorhizobium sp. B2-3-13]|uniref:hypothetical protein n=1 Tax=Mesorhizobium sp. B2-3-13 TaxID=2589951 RepID=UPI001FED9C2D|nr:hypothetical protein [Mesorhizobium sp. B2-3-13]
MEGAISTSFPPIGPVGSDAFLDRLLHPARHFERPHDVLTDVTLPSRRSVQSFRRASDACAVESVPALRMPPGATEPVSFDAIVDALRQLAIGSFPAPVAVVRSTALRSPVFQHPSIDFEWSAATLFIRGFRPPARIRRRG